MKISIIIILALSIGFGAGFWFSSYNRNSADSISSENSSDPQSNVLFYRNPMNPAITSPVPAKDEMGMDYIPVYAEKKKKNKQALFYRNPMNPAITSPVPAQDEMGMDYIPVYENDDNENDVVGTVSIDPVTVQNIGVKTSYAMERSISKRLNALGRIEINEERLARLHPKTSGWIKKQRIDVTGSTVRKDTILLSIYSPDLVAAQREYLLALKNWESVKTSNVAKIKQTTKTVLDSALDRLELLDVPAHQIRDLNEKRKINKYLHIHSPFSGTVINIGAREGQYITPQDELYRIADLKKVWVSVDVYEDEIAWVKTGDKVEMKVRAVPGEVFSGKVDFIYPFLTGKTRTVKVRLEFDNKKGYLKPGMFASVVLRTNKRDKAVVVPSSAIVRTGENDQVFVVRDEGKFEPRDVQLGMSADGHVQILSGVKVGDEVVTSSTFLIDSESKLKEATAKMMESMKLDSSTMGMDDMSMGDMDMNMVDMNLDNKNDLDMSDMDMSDMKMSE